MSLDRINLARMEDDLEEKVLKQACASQMKLLSRFAVGFFNRPSIIYFVKLLLRPEIFLLAIFVFVICFYIQAIELNANGFISRISNTLRFKSSKSKISFTSSLAEKDSWEERKKQSAVYAVQGRRPRMEDRWVTVNCVLSLGCHPKNIFQIFSRILIDSENSRARGFFSAVEEEALRYK